MRGMELNVAAMHQMVNRLHQYRLQLEKLKASLPVEPSSLALHAAADSLLGSLKAWDDSMVQRKSTAYDDVENFPNRFTANYMFLLNQAESDLPRLNQPVLDQLSLMNTQWDQLRARGTDLLNREIPAINNLFWKAGVGALWNP